MGFGNYARQPVACEYFVIEAYSRRIVGCRIAYHVKTETALDAIDMARWSRGNQLPELLCDSGAGSPNTLLAMGSAPPRSVRPAYRDRW